MQQKFFYHLAVEDDAEEIIEFLCNNFVYEEPATRSLNIRPDDARELYTTIVHHCLRYPFSTVVTTADGTIAAVLMNNIWKREDGISAADYDLTNLPEGLAAYMKMSNIIHADFWEMVPSNVTAVLFREFSLVSKPFQRQGIAKKMVTCQMSIDKLKMFNIGGVVSETSSFANQTLLAKQGFKCLRELAYSDVLDTQGNCLIVPDDGAKGLRLNYKPIEKFELAPES
ncbi:unnamed protein product [Caenorhabditis bovis]|uniref:aralkylamine N-acetyltransferase n=1 Tax=Caenorhabditis bovis TaxID=2654633 RepID=A0A8S1FAP6_9PELO|nr:unnamed protein product [Caenorhabditis bovis]